jgi:hypothetical protein
MEQKRVQPFHSVTRPVIGNWGPLFHFPPTSYIIRNFRPADYSACHLLSRSYLARLIIPWRWRRYVRPKRRLTFNGLHDFISQKRVIFIATAVRTSNPTHVNHVKIFCSYLITFFYIIANSFPVEGLDARSPFWCSELKKNYFDIYFSIFPHAFVLTDFISRIIWPFYCLASHLRVVSDIIYISLLQPCSQFVVCGFSFDILCCNITSRAT